MTMSKSVQKTISLIMGNEFQHFHTLWRFYASLVNFCIEGGCHVTSDSELDMGCLASLTEFSPPDLCPPASFHVRPLVPPKQVHGSFYLGLHPQLLSLLHFHLSGALPSGTSFKAMSFLVHSSFQGSFLKQSSYLHRTSISVGVGVEGMA